MEQIWKKEKKCKEVTGLEVDGKIVKSIRSVGNENVKYTSAGITGLNRSGFFSVRIVSGEGLSSSTLFDISNGCPIMPFVVSGGVRPVVTLSLAAIN